MLSTKRQITATVLGAITLACAALFYLSFGFVILQSLGGTYDGVALPIISLVLTLPPAVVCTIIAMILVGPKRCKLAWISFCSYPLLFMFMFIFVICTQHHQ